MVSHPLPYFNPYRRTVQVKITVRVSAHRERDAPDNGKVRRVCPGRRESGEHHPRATGIPAAVRRQCPAA